MFKILEKRYLNDSVYLMKIEAPRVANKAKPGQFIILRTDEEGERIPLTIADYNKEDKSVTLVVQGLGASTLELGKYIATDDGSYGFKGRVTDLLEDMVKNKGINYNRAIVIGPMIMMKFMCILTKELNIPTTVSLNPIMVDGTGMCGACRVTVGGEVKFACVDGPEFNGHLVDFDESIRRQAIYKTEEGRAFLKLKEGNTNSHGGCGCRGDLKNE